MNDRHPLEVVLNAPASDILSAIQAGFRAITDVKGKLAEFYLERELARLAVAGAVVSYKWQDLDGQPDFLLEHAGKQLKLECKNIRTKELFRKPAPGYKVELQKTRNSRDGTPTRAYSFDEFDILAVCLFNHTHRWEYLYVRTKDLQPRPEDASLIKIMQCVPFTASGPWKAALADVLRSP